MNWFEDKEKLAGAIEFIIQYKCLFGWHSYLRKKTPCIDFGTDLIIPDGLEEAIKAYLNGLPKTERIRLNRMVSQHLGECFFVREAVLVRMLARILAGGDPREQETLLQRALEMQIEERLVLLESLKETEEDKNADKYRSGGR